MSLMMQIRILLSVALLSALIGCGKERTPIDKSSEEMSQKENASRVFTINSDDVKKVSVFYGNGDLRFVLVSEKDIRESIKYFNDAVAATGGHPSDLFGTVEVESVAGETEILEITGAKTIFYDKKTGVAYKINQQQKSFSEWAEEKEVKK